MTNETTSKEVPYTQPPAGDHLLPPVPVFPALPKTGEALFDDALRTIFLHEGFYSDDPNDKGGATQYGISLALARKMGVIDMDLNHDGVIDEKDIKLVTPQFAVDFYRRVFWLPYPYRDMPPAIAVKTCNLAVNMGAGQAHKLLQRAVRAWNGLTLTDDGVLGPQSMKEICSAYQPCLLSALRSEAAGFYRLLVEKNPKSGEYLSGWLNRAYY